MSSSIYNSGNVVIEPEIVDLSANYCFTFNPAVQPLDSQGQIYNSSLWQFNPHETQILNLKAWYVVCRNLLENLKGATVSKMVLEISKKGRYHFHGYIKITDIMSFYTFDIPLLESKSHYCICKELGDAPGDKKTTYKTWPEYLAKQQHFIRPFLLKNDIDPDKMFKSDDVDDDISNKYIIGRNSRLKERAKELIDKKCRICKKDYKTTIKKSVVCKKCECTDFMPN